MNVFFDIETTGLPENDERVEISLIGVLSEETGIRQYMGESSVSEFLTEFVRLQAIAKQNSESLSLVSYNGNYFDIPIILENSKKRDLDFSNAFSTHCKTNHIDLFNVARQFILNKGEPISESTRYISKDQACMKMNIYTPKCISAQKCAIVMKEYLECESKKDFMLDSQNASEFFQILQHNALDLSATAMLYHEFKRWGWL